MSLLFLSKKCDRDNLHNVRKTALLMVVIANLIFPFSSISQQNISSILLEADRGYFEPILSQKEHFEIQLIYGEIDRSGKRPKIIHHSFNLHDNYFYPASSVKLPIAILALEQLNHLSVEGLDMYSRMEHGAHRPPQSPAVSDSSAQSLYPSIAHYVRKIFLYSDNDAYNRLFEFLGQSWINQRLQELSIENTRLLHRVGISGFDAEENQWINPVSLYQGEKLLYHRDGAQRKYEADYAPSAQLKGNGYYKNDQLIKEPMDFSQKNYLPLTSLLCILERIILPEAFAKDERFDLSEAQYQWLWKAMGQYPKESEYPSLPDMEDGYVKFFLNGGAGERINPHTRILNKVGFAYGYLTDVAYIVDFESGAECFISAVIHVNKNGIFNDDTYEYDEIGLPFLKRVGEVLLTHTMAQGPKNKSALLKYQKAISD